MSDSTNRIFCTSAWRELRSDFLGLSRCASNATFVLRGSQKWSFDALCKGSRKQGHESKI
jgi:hypothetical protein